MPCDTCGDDAQHSHPVSGAAICDECLDKLHDLRREAEEMRKEMREHWPAFVAMLALYIGCDLLARMV